MTGLWHKISSLEKSVKRLWFVSLLNLLGWVALTAFLLIQTACVTTKIPQKRAVAVPVFLQDSMIQNEKRLGSTGCQLIANHPIIKIEAQLDQNDFNEVLFHELVHANQSLSYDGGCIAWREMYGRDPVFRFNTEAEAHCATIMAFVPNARYPEALEQVLQVMWSYYGLNMGLTEAQNRHMVLRYCREVKGAKTSPSQVPKHQRAPD